MPPTTVLIILPSLAVAYSLHRSVLISARQNVKVAISTILEVSGIALVMTILVSTTSLQGAMAAAVAMSVGRVGSTLYLWVTARKALRSEPSVRYL
jgi:O-antigen/teichoic acid export membrane protein